MMVQGKVKEVEKVWFRSSELCEYLGIKPRTLEEWRSTAIVHYYKIGRVIFYKKSEIDRLIEKNKVI